MRYFNYTMIKYAMIGFLIAVALYVISLFFGFGLIGGIIGFFIAGIISSYKGKVNAKNGAIQGLIIGSLGWIVIFPAMNVVFSVPNFNSFIGDYGLIIPSKNLAEELLLSISYIVASILGGIAGSKIRRQDYN